MAQWHKPVILNARIGVQFPFEEKIYLFIFIFEFLRSGVEAKRGVEFRHSTRNASRGTECVNTRFPLPTLLYASRTREAQREADFI